MNVMELEDPPGIAGEHLEFPLWYLEENGLILGGDSGRFTITVKGVDVAEASGSAWQKADRLLSERRARPVAVAVESHQMESRPQRGLIRLSKSGWTLVHGFTLAGQGFLPAKSFPGCC